MKEKYHFNGYYVEGRLFGLNDLIKSLGYDSKEIIPLSDEIKNSPENCTDKLIFSSNIDNENYSFQIFKTYKSKSDSLSSDIDRTYRGVLIKKDLGTIVELESKFAYSSVLFYSTEPECSSSSSGTITNCENDPLADKLMAALGLSKNKPLATSDSSKQVKKYD
jgi:hypothetical protein